MHNILSGISAEVQWSSFRGTIWKSSSSSSSSEHPGVLAGVVLGMCAVVLCGELNDSHLCTGLGGVFGVFVVWQVLGQMKCVPCWKHGGFLVSFLVEWESQQYLNHYHSLHLLAMVSGRRLHSVQSQSDQIVFHQIAHGVYDLVMSRRMWCRLVLWLCQGWLDLGLLTKIGVKLWQCSIWNILLPLASNLWYLCWV